MSGFHTIIPLAVGALLLLASLQSAHAQPYRLWVDTTLPDPVIPRMLGADTTFVFSAYALEFSHDHPIANMWTYATVMNIDNYLYRIYGDAIDLYGTSRYDSLLRSAPAGKHVIPWLGYAGSHSSYVTEASRAREVLFFPFDSSQLRLVPDFSPVQRSKEWMFSQYAYDSIGRNSGELIDKSEPLEAIYFTSSANTIVASGIAFAFEPDQHIYRWDSVIKNGIWWPAYRNDVVQYDSLIRSDHLFLGRNYGWEEVVIDTVENDTTIVLHGEHKLEHRSPHYIVVKGHLFQGGAANSTNPLLRVKVYYDVDKGKTYRDSSNTYVVADTNLRFLYASFDVRKDSLLPEDLITPNWNAYRELLFPINFQNNRIHPDSAGMGGPTDTMVTAQKIDIEVEYLGGERVALHAVGIRDSIANLLLGSDQASDDYYDLIDTELMTVGRADNYVVDSAFLTIDVTDEPMHVEFTGFRKVNERLNNYFSHPFLDSLSGMHGDASPHLQHLGFSDWMQTLSYFGGKDPIGVSQYGTPTDRIPDIPEHNGGRFHIPVLFELDSLGKPDYIDTARRRIEDMNETFQVYLFGAADPTPVAPHQYFFGTTRIQNHRAAAKLARHLGYRIRWTLGPNSYLDFDYDPATGLRDTASTSAPLPTHLRVLAGIGLCYGAKAFRYYSAQPNPVFDTAADGGPGGGAEMFFVDFPLVDPPSNVADWKIYRPSWPLVQTGEIENYYTGFRSMYEEMASLNRWLKEVGRTMVGLQWREAYSMYWQAARPNEKFDSGRVPRPLPPDEIVTSVTARHPITGAVDPAWQTYVELGFFETVIDTTGGIHDRMKDRNYIAVLNRRVFETANYDEPELTYSDTVKRVMDTLTETRLITLELNLANPDTTQQFNRFIRVREVAPDTASLPLIGKRRPLDTVVAYDVNGKSKVKLMLGPGRAALLEITYTKPDLSVLNARLDHNNQRKILYEPHGQRYYMTWYRYDTTQGDHHIYFRRSFPVDTLGAILWEPMEHHVSGSATPLDPAPTENFHPSLTYRRINDTILIVSIVWTAHPTNVSFAGKREVLLREVEYHDYYDSVNNVPVSTYIWTPEKKTVAYHEGLNPYEWGTPAISSAGFGEYIAWSDSAVGIVVRGLLRDQSVLAMPSWTPPDTVNSIVYGHGYPPGKYPTMPPFTHRGLNDTNVGIAWQQEDDLIYTGIYYGRLTYTPPPGGPIVSILPHSVPGIFASPYSGYGDPEIYLHPSLDQTQDAFGRLMEGLAYERRYYLDGTPLEEFDGWYCEVAFRAVTLDTAGLATFQGNNVFYQEYYGLDGPYYSYPVASSQNQIMSVADSSEIPLFSTIYAGAGSGSAPLQTNLLETVWDTVGSPWLVRHDDPPYKLTPRGYSFGSSFESAGTASIGSQKVRHAAVYTTVPDSTIMTSREYFARLRPGGYLAEGREVKVRLIDSLGLSASARLHDVWLSDATSGRPTRMVTTGEPDSLHQLLDQLRSKNFTTGDSVRIGCEVHLSLAAADSSAAVAINGLVELVDSTTGAVVLLLDSIRVDGDTPQRSVQIDSTLDLLSGTYFVRLRLEGASVSTDRSLAGDSLWSASQVMRLVDDVAARAAVRLGPTTGNTIRISAQPNPFSDRTEIRFSIGRDQNVTIVIVDASGREVARPIRDERFDAGRYAVEFETGNLVEGTYVMELRAGSSRAVEKLIVRR